MNVHTYVFVTPTHSGSINTDKQIDLNAQFVSFGGKPKTSVKHPFHNDYCFHLLLNIHI